MKSFPILPFLILCASLVGISASAEENYDWPGDLLELSKRKEVADLSIPEDLNHQYPESFEWYKYIAEDGSTSDQRLLAKQSVAIPWERLLLVEQRERNKRLQGWGITRAESFDEMQKLWRTLSAKECLDFAGPSEVYRGSGYKVSYPFSLLNRS